MQGGVVTKPVVIVGGGYGGITVAKALDAELDVVLVDPKDAFVHAVAALRGLVDEAWAPWIFYPYERLLERGRFVRDRVVGVDPEGVSVSDGTRIDAAYVVLASGSSYPYPAKMRTDDSAAALSELASTRRQLAAATRVLLVGAGPVGIELAGEITDRWPDKKIVIVDFADDVLAGRYSDELRTSLREQLAERDVRLVLGSALVEGPQLAPGTLGAVAVTTDAGEQIEADIWFRCHGVTPNTEYLGDGLSQARQPDGFIEVDDQLRLVGQDNVFAIGDITALDEPKRGGIAGRHARVVVDNVRALARGDAPDAVYRPGPSGVVVPLGKMGGASEVLSPEGPAFLGPEGTSQRKGQDLMVHRYAEMFNLTAPEPDRDEAPR